MADITQSGAPNKHTVGEVGDIYTNSNTGEQFECIAIYKTIAEEGIIITYDWEEIKKVNDDGSAISPVIAVSAIDGGHRVRITDVNGVQTFDVMDGTGDMEAIKEYVDTTVPTVVEEQLNTQLDDKIQESVDQAVSDAMTGVTETDRNAEIDSWF